MNWINSIKAYLRDCRKEFLKGMYYVDPFYLMVPYAIPYQTFQAENQATDDEADKLSSSEEGPAGSDNLDGKERDT